jgi:hypothetical protein
VPSPSGPHRAMVQGTPLLDCFPRCQGASMPTAASGRGPTPSRPSQAPSRLSTAPRANRRAPRPPVRAVATSALLQSAVAGSRSWWAFAPVSTSNRSPATSLCPSTPPPLALATGTLSPAGRRRLGAVGSSLPYFSFDGLPAVKAGPVWLRLASFGPPVQCQFSCSLGIL